MNEKILVEIRVPAAGKRFDVYIPAELRLGEITWLVSDALSELSGNQFRGTAETTLCDADTGEILDVNLSAGELGIREGSALLLI